MNKINAILLSTILVMVTALVVSGCRAKYQTIHKADAAIISAGMPGSDDQVPVTDNPDFTVAADPTVAPVGDEITFTGECTGADPVITWDFGDETMTGATCTKSFASAGEKEVAAQCERSDGPTLQATITVTITDAGGEDPFVPGDDDDDTAPGDDDDDTAPGSNDDDDDDDDGGEDPEDDPPLIGDPGQNPSQNPGQNPGQNPAQQ